MKYLVSAFICASAAVACGGLLEAAPAQPIKPGRWALADGETPPTAAARAKLCSSPEFYLDVSAARIKEVAPPHTSVCAMPTWRAAGGQSFEGTLGQCTPPVVPGEEIVSVEVKADGFMLYNNAPFVWCGSRP